MNAFSKLQQDIIGRLTATVADVPSLAPVNGQIQWITEDKGDLANIIARAIGKLGIIGIVLTPGGGKVMSIDHAFPIAFHCPIEIQLQENVTINRGASGTQVPVLDLLQFTMKRLHLWSPTNQRLNRIFLDERPYLLVADTPILTYNVRFNYPLTIS